MKKKRQPETKESNKQQNQSAAQINDLPPISAQGEQVKGGNNKGTTNCIIFFER